MVIKSHFYHFFLTALLFLTGCAATQKVNLDPIYITASPGSEIYQGSYPRITDIIHTKLDLNFNWDSAFVIGRAEIDAKPYFNPLNQVVLDAKKFKINSVALVKGYEKQPLKYTYNGKSLSIMLDKTYQRDEKFKLFIDYIAMPNKLKVGYDIQSEDQRGLYFINPAGNEAGKPTQVWTQGETEYNSTWFPTINDPQEKMTQEISLTVPKQMVTLSNGLLDFSSENGDGTRTDSWRMEKPHSTYLTMIAAGSFSIIKDEWRDKEVSYYMEPGFAQNAKLIFGNTPEMLEFFSEKTGVDYPWEKYSQIVVRDFVAGAMENTTASVFFERMNMTEGEFLDETYEDIISHELFHHWFGDLVTCESWANLSLNEAFATYGEYLWNEHKYGRDYADSKSLEDRMAYFQDKSNWEKKVVRFNYQNNEQMFDAVSYQKGGQIMHMLRKAAGDKAFFESLKLYLNKYAYKTAEIHNLRMAFEEVTGRDWNWFFNQWFLASGHPVLQIQTSYDASAKQAVITIQQKQDLNKQPLYTLPMSVDIYFGAKSERHEIVLNKASQTYRFPAPSEPELINVDAEKCILAEKNENKTVQQYTFQYEHAPLFMDRYEAVQNFQSMPLEKTARQYMIKALDDKSWYIRREALAFISKLENAEKESVYEKVKAMALEDERSYVRAAAVTALQEVYKGRDNSKVLEKAAADKAPSVQRAVRK